MSIFRSPLRQKTSIFDPKIIGPGFVDARTVTPAVELAMPGIVSPDRREPVRKVPVCCVLPPSDSVILHDGPLRYLVKSRKRPNEDHLVQLDAYRNNGACSCEDFTLNLIKEVRKGGPPSPKSRCWHITAVREYVLNWFVDEVSRRRSDTTADERDGLY